MSSQTKTGPIYENCTILAPDGKVLCRTSMRKLNWYLNKNLADPVCIKLKFEPSGRKNAEDAYYLADKSNRCVVCGSDFDLNMHHVVPRCYRKHFPEHLKNHASHDVVATCAECHEAYETHAMQLKLEIAEQYKCPLNIFVTDLKAQKVRKMAHALLNYENVIPETRKSFLSAGIDEYLGRPHAERDLIELSNLAAENVPKQTDQFASVVSKVDVQEFIERWRHHFTSVMKPQFLPLGWDVMRKEA